MLWVRFPPRAALISIILSLSLSLSLCTGGPFSILHEVALAFTLTGLREVLVRRVDQRVVALDLVELSLKDQYITRSDMWRITCSLVSVNLLPIRHQQENLAAIEIWLNPLPAELPMVAQLVEHLPRLQSVVGFNPI